MTLGLKMKFFAYDEPSEIHETVNKRIKKAERFGPWSADMQSLLKDFL